MSENRISVGGFHEKGQDTRISPHITTFSRGLSANLHISFFLLTERTRANKGGRRLGGGGGSGGDLEA
jgi:hypothetical protein